ncbi:NAD-dependent epimerase/dehydratase family protein [Plebeiibacterium sediminum]|uniref:NAD-dependent epimerase/dehydratase family protein n=1 Tax=Plebeiibacterium sediminum TaxID=2992112 RepID=A0AAE3M7U6_9BACT|nr:NAD-dependent epimerase/dehydratase family protein [Plebeiobacterium sediminum]MCW3788420.1 NAD-dependent epimerase/dehydratase family protein [Plebeiobacterium sediminum]
MVLVTGGTGLVGAHLLYRLLKEGKEVRALKRETSDIQKTKFVFDFYGVSADSLFEKIQWVDGDLLDYESLEKAAQGVDVVYHTGALVSFNPSLKDQMLNVNEEGTANLVNICIENKIRKFCYISSIATLGNSKNGEVIDEMSYWQGGRNHSAYSISKFRAEMQVWRATKEGLDAVIVNPSVIIGPGDWDLGSAKIIKTIYKGLKFYTPGGTGFVDVRDVVDALIQLCDANIVNQRFLLNGANLSYQSLFTSIATALKVKAPTLVAGKVLTGMAWRFEKLKNMMFGSDPLITKDSARTSLKTTLYSGQLITDTIGFKYRPIEDTVKETADYFLKTNH